MEKSFKNDWLIKLSDDRCPITTLKPTERLTARLKMINLMPNNKIGCIKFIIFSRPVSLSTDFIVYLSLLILI